MLLRIVIFGALLAAAEAQIEFSGDYSQNFNDLRSEGNESLQGTGEVGFQKEIPKLEGWVATKARTRLESDGNLLKLFASADGADGGRLYSFGTPGEEERSLGLRATKTTTPVFGVSFINMTGREVQDVTISYTGKQYWSPSGDKYTRLRFAYGLSGGVISRDDFLTSDGMIFVESLDVVEPLPENQMQLKETLSNLQWQPGQTLFLRWAGVRTGGSNAALGIDDFRLTVDDKEN